jgi:hypothetical protein
MERVSIDETVIKVSCAIIATEKEQYFVNAPTFSTSFGQELSGEKIYTAINNINVDLEKNANVPFIPFNQLNENIVTDWIKNKLGKEEIDKIENKLKEDINKQKINTLSGLPWENN